MTTSREGAALVPDPSRRDPQARQGQEGVVRVQASVAPRVRGREGLGGCGRQDGAGAG